MDPYAWPEVLLYVVGPATPLIALACWLVRWGKRKTRRAHADLEADARRSRRPRPRGEVVELAPCSSRLRRPRAPGSPR